MASVTCGLTAKDRDQLRNPTLISSMRIGVCRCPRAETLCVTWRCIYWSERLRLRFTVGILMRASALNSLPLAVTRDLSPLTASKHLLKNRFLFDHSNCPSTSAMAPLPASLLVGILLYLCIHPLTQNVRVWQGRHGQSLFDLEHVTHSLCYTWACYSFGPSSAVGHASYFSSFTRWLCYGQTLKTFFFIWKLFWRDLFLSLYASLWQLAEILDKEQFGHFCAFEDFKLRVTNVLIISQLKAV